VSSNRNFRPSTLAIHAGAPRDLHANSILFPIHQATAYVQEAVGVHKGHTYSRTSNPTVDALEQTIAALEGTSGNPVFSFGNGCHYDPVSFASEETETMSSFRRLSMVERSVCSDKCWVG
jgi:O-acetylhomoserine/O-acetylserine sulfhydrylase-like pyridoxal-dependent enzyme